ncbi:MAG TPA: outer membrane protein assembly factor BamD [Tepidisphaeraceae bacterium]|nr:outer membrane protein assembly factor BamD [Tepidisphaeraceae bacterium]
MKIRFFALWMVCSPIALAQDASEQRTWELTPDGRWQQTVAPAGPTAVQADPALDRIREMLGNQRFDAAFDASVRWLLANRDSPLRDQGLFLAAQALFGAGDRLKSFYYCDELLDTYPDSPLWYPAVELQYQIADSFLSGWRRTFIGIPLAGWTDEGIEMMFRIQQRAPGSVLAEKALMRTADFYYDDEQFDLSADAYGAFAARYPRSPEAIKARLRQAFSNYAQFTGVRFDPTPAINARAQLAALIAEYPDVAEQQRLPALVESIDRSLARKLMVKADFYRRTGKPQSAAYLLTAVVARYPNLAEAEDARAQLASLLPPALQPSADSPDAVQITPPEENP